MWILLSWLVAGPLLLWWGTWCLHALLGVFPSRAGTGPGVGPLDVLIPAHNEEAALPALLASLDAGSNPEHRGVVIVVADHCSDATTSIARDWGAQVVERRDGVGGKPGALRAGLEHYGQLSRGAGLVIVDADCRVNEGFLAGMAAALRRAPQAQSVNMVGGGSAAASAVSFGVALRNVLRPRGLSRLGASVALSGTGCAFRADALGRVRFEDALAEDLALTYDLLRAGERIAFAPSAQVTSDAPPSTAALVAQRSRWEQGSLATFGQVPRAALGVLRTGRLRQLFTVADLSAPPLTLMAAAWFLGSITALTIAFLGVAPAGALLPWAVSLLLLGGYVLLGALWARGLRGLGELACALPAFLALKFRVYRGGRTRHWERTERAE